MPTLPETSNMLSEWPANEAYALGDHTEFSVRTGAAGLPLGDSEFDPSRHQLSDINHLAPMTAATGDFYVREVQPFRPLLINVIHDARSQGEHPAIYAQKHTGMDYLATAIADAAPGIADSVRHYHISNGNDVSSAAKHAQEIIAPTDEQAQAEIEDIALRGLTFILSDFRSLKLPNATGEVLAIKMNHPLERSLPANVGFVSLGGAFEVNTNNARQLGEVNRRLTTIHEGIMSSLQESQVEAVDIVVTPKTAEYIDSKKADIAISDKLKHLAKIHKH